MMRKVPHKKLIIVPSIVLVVMLAVLFGAGGTYTKQPTNPIVAASNTPGRYRMFADFACDGTHDEVTIAAAIAELRTTGDPGIPGYNDVGAADYASQGGTVKLLAGDYHIDSTLTLTPANCPHNFTLEGEGPGTVIWIRMTDGSNGIVFDGTTLSYGFNRIHVRNLMIVGTRTSEASRSGDSLVMDDVNFRHVEGVTFELAGRDALACTASTEVKGAQNNIIRGCQFCDSGRHGLYIFGEVHDFNLSSSHFEANAAIAWGSDQGHGLYADGVNNLLITGCHFEDTANGGYDINVVFGDLITLNGVDAEETIYLHSHLPIIVGNVNIGTGVLKILGDDNVLVSNVSAPTLSDLQGLTVSVVGCRFAGVTANKVMQGEQVQFIGNRLVIASNYTIQCTADEGRIVVSDNMIKRYPATGTFTISAGGKSGIRAIISDNNFRTISPAITGFAALNMTGNHFNGGSVVVPVTGITETLCIVGNSFRGAAAITFDAACAGYGRIGENVGSGNASDTINIANGASANISLGTNPGMTVVDSR